MKTPEKKNKELEKSIIKTCNNRSMGMNVKLKRHVKLMKHCKLANDQNILHQIQSNHKAFLDDKIKCF